MAMVAANSDTPCNSANRARRSENSGSKGSKSAATKTENQGGLSPKSSGDRIPLAFSQPFGLLTLALDFATAESARSRKSGSLDRAISGLPMILLEDFMESQASYCALAQTLGFSLDECCNVDGSGSEHR